MAPTILSSRYMSIDLLFMTGSGVRTGTHGRVPGIGDITRVGGMYTVAGLVTGIGIAATRITITTTAALSITHMSFTADIVSCTAV